jgi:hypothetical protein
MIKQVYQSNASRRTWFLGATCCTDCHFDRGYKYGPCGRTLSMLITIHHMSDIFILITIRKLRKFSNNFASCVAKFCDTKSNNAKFFDGFFK